MAGQIILFTVGFAGKSAEQFFELLRRHDVRRVIDVRLFNCSQLTGFTKRDDLAYFLHLLLGATYEHRMEFAPTKPMLDGYKKDVVSWEEYEERYKAILTQHQPHLGLAPDELDHACLLCSEAEPAKCHRRLAAEYLCAIWPAITIQHL